MALILPTRYAGRANPISVDYPQGSFKNKTAPGATDGTLLEQDWANDIQGFLQSLLATAGITANNTVDKVGASQYFDALQQIAVNQQATTTLVGVSRLATAAESVSGTVNNAAITPATLQSWANAKSLGINQTWQDLTGSRAKDTVYTNSTGRPIQVSVVITQGNSGLTSLTIGGLSISEGAPVALGERYSLQGIVPAGATYSIATLGGVSTLFRWSELR